MLNNINSVEDVINFALEGKKKNKEKKCKSIVILLELEQGVATPCSKKSPLLRGWSERPGDL